MSAILQGADRAYLREYNESEDERRLDALQDSIGSIRKATKGGKYLGSDVIDIMVEIQGFAEKLGIDPDELEYAENQVREAMNNLESAIYGLEEPFEDAIRALQNKIDDSEELDEMFDNDAFNNIFKDKKDRGSMENPEPKHFELAKSLEELLKRHDWTYNYSDDSRAWSKGKKEADEIRRMKRTLSDLGLEAIASEMYDKHSPFTKKDANVQEEKQRLDPKCWDGYKKQGTKMKGDTRVNNCVPVKETKSNILRGLNEGELQEGWKEWTAGALMIASLWGINNRLAQDAYDNSHQLQQLTQLYQVAQERSDTEKMKEVKERIRNHKTRLDIGKGDVDFDGRPGNDDIKDLDYLNPPK